MLERPWAADHERLVSSYETNPHHGLTWDEARRRLRRHGPNELKTLGRAPGYLVLLRQFVNPLVIILLIAAGISLGEKDYSDVTIIAVIVIVNALIGWAQEFKAERAMAKLRQILAPKARVIRESAEQMVAARTLVPGDVILLEAGDRVPADARVIEAQSLSANQAILTGEAVPDHKRPAVLDEKTALADRDNMVFLGTLIVAGQGVAVVTATGMKTQLGQIAEETLQVHEPLEGLSKKIANLSKYLLIFSVLLSFATLAVGLFEGITLPEMFKITISLLVSIVPESLPMVITVILSVGLLRIYRHRAIIRKLVAAETLGSITTICVDKTGTITEGEIMVEKIFAGGTELTVTGNGHRLSGDFYQDDSKVNPTRFPAIR
ncbi:MAG TPA: HAD-IC family P-type ATPase, partial [Candidatus Saccharimonadales bacterium]|nr:HAD-IC family P-type ATPase [Candidatus Saccharimonadales bacterium]